MGDSCRQHEHQEIKPRQFSNMTHFLFLAATASAAAIFGRDYPSADPLTACPGYKASNVQTSATGLTADLSLAGKACDVYGTDLTNLTLEVSYDTGEMSAGTPDLSIPVRAKPVARNSSAR